jgi:molybdenum cofactor synthesis domain-containing protein
MTTAAMLVIGDEILTGKVHDSNSHALARVLFSRGVRLRRVVVVPDDVDDIAESLRALSRAHDHVFTSGGIGPTHDDVTYEAVARAFGRTLTLHAPTFERMRAHYIAKDGNDGALNAARRRMAELPSGAEVLLPGANLWVPVVYVENVYVLPGIPSLFELLLDGMKERFTGEPIHRRLVYTWKPEGDIAAGLDSLQKRYPMVQIGSYPHPGAKDHRGLVTLESTDAENLVRAAAEARILVDGFDIEQR